MYQLISEDLTHLGGPMGSEYTTTNYRKFFNKLSIAKAFAEIEYQKVSKKRKRIKWSKTHGEWCSGDLLHVMYTIKKIKVEDNIDTED